jgi:hypothetical protein
MLTPDEVTHFFQGDSVDTVELTYNGSQATIRFTRITPEHVVAYIPRATLYKEGSFNIEAALSDELCGVTFSKANAEYIVHISHRHQIRSVGKIALNHLGWLNMDMLSIKFTNTASDT